MTALVPTTRRTHCPLCESPNLSDGHAPHVELRYPLLPTCVDTPREADLFASFTIASCTDCGLITLRDVVDPSVLYATHHNDGVGRVWAEHYETFARLIGAHLRGDERLVEVGAGQGKLLRLLLPFVGGAADVFDPNYEQYEGRPTDGVTVHAALFTPQTVAPLAGAFDALVSSHTLEHYPVFADYFRAARVALKPGGLLATSVPNQETGFSRSEGNMLNLEHMSVCTNLQWLSLYARHGFRVEEVRLYRAHSLMVVARRMDDAAAALDRGFALHAADGAAALLADYTRTSLARVARIRALATPDKQNWLFGAHTTAQTLFLYGLSEATFAGVMDNSPLKAGKRLYGTGLVCRDPTAVLGPSGGPSIPLRVFVNVASYNAEVVAQLRALDPTVECVVL